MATDGDIIQLWNSFPNKGQPEAIVRLYRLGENMGIAAMEKELLSDSTIEAATKAFFGMRKHSKAGIITLRAIMREAIYLAKEKAGK